MSVNQWKRFIRSDRGSQVVELGMIVLPMFAIVFLILNCAWVVFGRGTLQYAVRQGCRYAVTSQVMSGMGQDASIKSVVLSSSFGFLTGANSDKNITIQYFDPKTLKATNSNAGGNIVQVSIENAALSPLVPFWISSDPLHVSVVSSDVMESSPGGIPPAR